MRIEDSDLLPGMSTTLTRHVNVCSSIQGRLYEARLTKRLKPEDSVKIQKGEISNTITISHKNDATKDELTSRDLAVFFWEDRID